jgi:hypothetical protein
MDLTDNDDDTDNGGGKLPPIVIDDLLCTTEYRTALCCNVTLVGLAARYFTVGRLVTRVQIFVLPISSNLMAYKNVRSNNFWTNGPHNWFFQVTC